MPDVTRLLDAAAAGDRHAAAELLPLVYDELRKLAAVRMAVESPDQTLQPTALVHEAYLRLLGPADDVRWENRGHFFAAAAEAMRRILVDAARRKHRDKHGGRLRVELPDVPVEPEVDSSPWTRPHPARCEDPVAARVVELPVRRPVTTRRRTRRDMLPPPKWTYARAWAAGRRETDELFSSTADTGTTHWG